MNQKQPSNQANFSTGFRTILTYCIFFALYGVVFGGIILRIIRTDVIGLYRGDLVLPSFFPTQTKLEAFSLIALTALAISNAIAALNGVQINRRKNVLVNSFILAGMLFAWYFMLIQSANLVGALVLAIADILVSLIVITMLYLVDHKAGLYFIPTLLWTGFRIACSIALVVLN